MDGMTMYKVKCIVYRKNMPILDFLCMFCLSMFWFSSNLFIYFLFFGTAGRCLQQSSKAHYSALSDVQS